MGSYRIYCRDKSGRVGLTDWILARDDHDAVAEASKLKHDAMTWEVWEGRRFVANSEGQEAARNDGVERVSLRDLLNA